MQSRSLEILVGFFVCLGIAAMFLLTFKVANLTVASSHGGSYTVGASFDDVGSLKAGAPVKIAGVVIGRVRAVTIDPKTFQAKAALELSSIYNDIPTDSVAKIQTSGLLGEQYIALDPGGAAESLKNGDVIRLTQSAFVLENLIGQFLVSATQKGGNSGGGDDAKTAPKPATP